MFIRGFHPVKDEKYPLERHPAYPMIASGGYPKYDHALAMLTEEEFDGEITLGVKEQQPILQEEQTNNAFEQEN